jgi:hypothetical protein
MAVMPRALPPLNASPFDGNGQFSQAWLRYFQQLADQLVTMDQLTFVSSEAAAALSAAIAPLDLRMGSAEAGLADHEARIVAHAARITALEERVDDIEARLTAAGIP